MRKLLLLAVITMTVVSCKKDCDCQGDGLFMYSQDFEVYSEDWSFRETADEAYFYYTFNFDRLTRTVCEIGQVTATKYDGNIQSPLSEPRHFNNGIVAWSETIRMDYAPGEITFIVSYSDYSMLVDRPKDMKFRVVLNW